MASLRGMRFWWFLTWYVGGTSFVLLVQQRVAATGIPTVWAFAIAFAVLFLMTFGVGFLIRAGRRRNEAPASPPR
jgi:hypothetical protein